MTDNSKYHDMVKDMHYKILDAIGNLLAQMEKEGVQSHDASAICMSAMCCAMGDVLMASAKPEKWQLAAETLTEHVVSFAKIRHKMFEEKFGGDPHSIDDVDRIYSKTFGGGGHLKH